MLLDGSGFTSLSLCFPLLPLYQHVVFQSLSPSVWLEEAEPLVLTGRVAAFFFGMIVMIHGAVKGSWKVKRKKFHLARNIKCTWLLTFVLIIFPLPVWRSCPFQESEPFVTSPTHPPHFHAELLLWVWLDAVNATEIFQRAFDHNAYAYMYTTASDFFRRVNKL